MHTGDQAEVGYHSDASGQWLLQDGFASGYQSGSTTLSYNGSGSYSNGITGVGIIFAYPPSSGPNNGPGGDGPGGEGEGGGSSSESGSSWIAVSGSVSITGSLTGSAYASGTLTGSLWSSWNDSLDGSANWSYAGSGSQSTTLSAAAGYLGTGSFSASGAVSGTGTYTESGSSLYNETHDYDYNLNASGTWELDGSSSAASYSGWTSSWASGSGATLVNGSSVIASVLPDVATTSFSGSATPGAGQSEVPTWLYDNVQRGERLQEQVPVLAEEGGSQQDLYQTAANGGSSGGSSGGAGRIKPPAKTWTGSASNVAGSVAGIAGATSSAKNHTNPKPNPARSYRSNPLYDQLMNDFYDFHHGILLGVDNGHKSTIRMVGDGLILGADGLVLGYNMAAWLATGNISNKKAVLRMGKAFDELSQAATDTLLKSATYQKEILDALTTGDLGNLKGKLRAVFEIAQDVASEWSDSLRHATAKQRGEFLGQLLYMAFEFAATEGASVVAAAALRSKVASAAAKLAEKLKLKLKPKAASALEQCAEKKAQLDQLRKTVKDPETLKAIKEALRELSACFAAGTQLLTPDGFKTIEDFREGDLVLSRDENNPEGAVEAKQVERVFVRTGKILHLHLQDKAIIRTTHEHPFYKNGEGWVDAALLKPGDRLASLDGQWIEVVDVVDPGEYQTVYNLRVADYHTYFVGCQEWNFSAWAHNANCDVIRYLKSIGIEDEAVVQKILAAAKGGDETALRQALGSLADHALAVNTQGRLVTFETDKLRIAQTLESNAEMRTLKKLKKDAEAAGGFHTNLPFDDQVHVFRHDGVDYLVNGHHRRAVSEKLGYKEMRGIYITESELLEYGLTPAQLVRESEAAIKKGNRIRW